MTFVEFTRAHNIAAEFDISYDQAARIWEYASTEDDQELAFVWTWENTNWWT